ncbi:MAG: HAMP domain-containing protein, partial [Pseudomonadota bacterium]|nr:HAMP domain-containing protein [Pseudomonadota bacterium]
MSKSSLRQQLVLPFVLLVIFVSISIGWVSYRAGETAVDLLTRRVLTDMVDRIVASTERHLSGALIALESISPDPATVPRVQPFSDDLATLEERFWAASGLFIEVNNYVYFCGADGRFVGVNRVKRNFVELYLREPGAIGRTVYAVLQPGDRGKILRSDTYDGRLRPWYRSAAGRTGPVWSEVYNDFSSKEPTITLAKSVYHADLSLAGVLATDVTLKTLTEFLRSLSVSQHGVAFVMDSAGLMIATSGEDMPFHMVDDLPQRLRASEMPTQLIRESIGRIDQWRNSPGNAATPLATTFASDSGTIELAAAHLGRKFGVDWISVVVVPRSDFMGGVTRGVFQSVGIALACVALTLILGLTVLNRLLQDVQKLSNAARRIGNGEILPRLNIARDDEIGMLARTFAEMEHNLRTDRLTQVANRESFQAQIELLQRQAVESASADLIFGVMFVDLDQFK